MRLSEYAAQIGLRYRAVLKMFHRGELNARQLPSGTIIVDNEHPEKRRAPKPRGFARTLGSKRRGGSQ